MWLSLFDISSRMLFILELMVNLSVIEVCFVCEWLVIFFRFFSL